MATDAASAVCGGVRKNHRESLFGVAFDARATVRSEDRSCDVVLSVDRMAGGAVKGSSSVSMRVGKVERCGYTLVAFDATVPVGVQAFRRIMAGVVAVGTADFEPNMSRC